MTTSRTRRKRVLVVDDDRRTVELVAVYLKREGYDVDRAFDGPTALASARDAQPDLIVLDVMLPGIDGVELCRRLRGESGVAIIMLTARTTERDKLVGLDAGADDYIVKPFSPGELTARVRAVLRRLPDVTHPRGPQKVTFGDIEVDFDRQSVTVAGAPASLTATEFRLLAALVSEPGRVFSRELLVGQVFGSDHDGVDRGIDVHIANLRRKIESNPRRPRYVVTVFGSGYRFDWAAS